MMTILDQQSNVLILPRASRAFLVGETGSGKSTLAEILTLEYMKAYSTKRSRVKTLVVDTKPRFKAEFELSGLTTKMSGRYRKWGIGSDVFKNSYAISANSGDVKGQLDRVFALGGDTVIVHSERAHELPFVSSVVTKFYEGYGASRPRIVYVDELADFFTNRSLGDIFQRIARNGRERNCAMVAASQRPRKIPTEVMTEMKRLYMFFLSYKEDLKHVYEFGIPPETISPQDFDFYLFDKKLKMQWPSNAYHVLNLEH